MDFNIKSLYLCVSDMNRAITFYEELLEQTVTIRDDTYSVFNINGFRLGLFAYEKMNEYHTFGNNCLPSLEVSSIGILKSKLSKLKIVFPLKQIGEHLVAEFEDSEGNHIEITTPIEKTDDINFGISNEFKSEYLTPIIQNVLFKAENEWDDYNEVYHCSKLIEDVKSNKNMDMDFHIMKKDEKYVGIALVSSGIIDYKIFFKEPINIEEDPREVLIFNYFHISKEGRGNGERWFKNIIQYYKSKNYKAMYLKSSHPKVFSMYNRLGKEIGEYSSISDNGLFKRTGKIFKIIL